MEKKKYIHPEMEITEFDTEDVITTSPPTVYEEDELPFVPANTYIRTNSAGGCISVRR